MKRLLIFLLLLSNISTLFAQRENQNISPFLDKSQCKIFEPEEDDDYYFYEGGISLLCKVESDSGIEIFQVKEVVLIDTHYTIGEWPNEKWVTEYVDTIEVYAKTGYYRKIYLNGVTAIQGNLKFRNRSRIGYYDSPLKDTINISYKSKNNGWVKGRDLLNDFAILDFPHYQYADRVSEWFYFYENGNLMKSGYYAGISEYYTFCPGGINPRHCHYRTVQDYLGSQYYGVWKFITPENDTILKIRYPDKDEWGNPRSVWKWITIEE